MTYYFLAIIDVHDKTAYRDYQKAAGEIIGPHLLKVHAISEEIDVYEGEFPATTLVLFEFASPEDFRIWWDSDEYAEAKKIRFEHATARLIAGFEATTMPAFS